MENNSISNRGGVTKKELAFLYFPTATSPHSAVKRLMSWINNCEELHRSLLSIGYEKNRRWFTPRELRLIVEYLGEP